MHGGYNYSIEQLRFEEFPHVKDTIYVDHAGATLYSKSQIDAVHKDLTSNLYGNPHSHNTSSKLATDTVDQIRYRILRFFRAKPDEYSLVFTSGCTDALRLLSDSFAFSDDNPRTHGGTFCFLQDNHTSVQGMREKVAQRGAEVVCVGEQEVASMLCVCPGHDDYDDQTDWRRHQGQGRPESQSSSEDGPNSVSRCLFAYPAQSNFSGRKYPLDWIEKVQQRGLSNASTRRKGQSSSQWYILLDAAAFVSTSQLDLSEVKPDFVTVSFYKIFGYPTGLGALLIHKRAGDTLTKSYYGGGTVNVSTVPERFQVFRDTLHDKYEDGTIPFLSIISLRHGLDSIERLAGGMSGISEHVFFVARYFYDNLRNLRHGNGRPLAHIYGDFDFHSLEGQGGVVTFNVLRADRKFVGYAEVDKFAQLHDIHLRTGCFCNIGACQQYLGLSSQLIRENFDAGHVCGDNIDLINGIPTGAIRISFGYMNTIADARACLRFLADSFLEKAPEVPTFPNPEWYGKHDTFISPSPVVSKSQDENEQFRKKECEMMPRRNMVEEAEVNSGTQALISGSGRQVSDIFLYPVKSCGAFRVTEWEMGPKGLLYDREWILVSGTGVTCSQKRQPKICLLTPAIDLGSRKLILHFPGHSPFELSLDQEGDLDATASLCTNKVCGDRVSTFDCGDDVSDWLSDVMDMPGTRLLRQQSEDTRKSKLKDKGSTEEVVPHRLSMVNESQLLLLSRPSVRVLQDKMEETLGDEDATDTRVPTAPEDISEDNLVLRFRANLVIDGGQPFEEEEWTSVKLGSNRLVCQGQCSRCQMICVDQDTGKRSREPLRTISKWRGKKVPFGMHTRIAFGNDDERQLLRVGDPVIIN